MATLSLPTNPSLEQMRKQARDLQRGVRARKPEALRRIAEIHPDADPATFPLHAAQLVIARAYGFSSWPRLTGYFKVISVYGRPGGGARSSRDSTSSAADRFSSLACSDYSDDAPEHGAAAGAILDALPGLTDGDIWAAAAAADVDAVRRIISRNAAAAGAIGGPYRWEPLCYLTYSRVQPVPSEDAVLSVARLLLDTGADPNAGYLWGGLPTPFTALTGVFGEGEQGPGRTPRHPYERALARILLDAGADPNDGQTLYNRMFRPDDSHLRLLFAYGLGRGDGGPWQRRLGPEALDTPDVMLRRQLDSAVPAGFVDRVRLLVDHGVDVRLPLTDGRRPADVALANGDMAMLDVLAAAGAEPTALTGSEATISALLAGNVSAADDAAIAAVRVSTPDLVRRAVDAGRVEAVPLLVDLGFDVDARGADGATALHWTGWYGAIETARVLLAAGADPDLRDPGFDATPLGWAEHARQSAYADMIRPLTGNHR